MKDLIVIGDTFSLPIFYNALKARGVSASYLCVDDSEQAERWMYLHVGTGELYETQRLTYGQALTDSLWELSLKNFEKAKSFLPDAKEGGAEGQVRWNSSSPKDQDLWKETAKRLPHTVIGKSGKLEEPGVFFKRGFLGKQMPPAEATQQASQLLELVSHGPFDYEVSYKRNNETGSLRSSMVLVATEYFEDAFFPLFEKRICATLNTFRFQRGTERAQSAEKNDQPAASASLEFFHSGADYLLQWGAQEVQVGSVRSLYSDASVGLRSEVDLRSMEALRGFFGKEGWLKSRTDPPNQVFVHPESLSCDGLPLIGAVPRCPGVLLSSGFSARTPNFLFEVAHLLVGALVSGKWPKTLEFASLKRFL